jgi:hypothetical protein
VASTADERQRDELATYARLLDPYYDLLAEAASRPGWFVDADIDSAEGMRHVGWMRDARLLIEAGVHHAPDGGMTARAARHALLLLRLGQCVRPGSVLDYGIAMRMKRGPCGVLRVALTSAESLDIEEFRRQVEPSLTDVLSAPGPPSDVLVLERSYGVSWLKRIIDGESLPDSLRRRLGASGRWWGRPLIYQDGAEFVACLNSGISLCLTTPDRAAHISETFDRTSPEWLPNDVVRAHFGHYADTIAALRLMRMVMAALVFRKRAGSFPARLADLASELGGDVPSDPYGGAFGYESNGDSAKLWSLRACLEHRPRDSSLEWILD